MAPQERPRQLRRDSTDAERALWRVLRNRHLEGFKFRRQQALGRYIVDFVCFSHRVVVEVDGGQHAEQVKADERRTKWLAGEGFRVIRFWNNDGLQKPEGVCRSFLEALESAPGHPSPSRRFATGPFLSRKGRGES